jgi:hypothetical protein
VRTVTVVLLSALTIATACRGKPKPKPAPGAKVETAEKPSTGLELPEGPGTPPVKSTKPVDGAILKKLSELTFKGFASEVKAMNDSNLWVYQKWTDHPVVRASIHVWPCNHKDNCWPIDLAGWKAHTEDLKGYLTDDLKAAPDTEFEVGQTDLHGTPMIYTYQLGQVTGTRAHGGSAFTHAYVLYYNDGVNEIRVLAEYKDDLLSSKEDMAAAVPRAELEKTAKAFMDVYTHAWQ